MLLRAFGDPYPLPSTVSLLDEIITDFIIETCHNAALSASYSRRQKIKVDDFKWVLRRDAKKLGRVVETAFLDKQIKIDRKVFNNDEIIGEAAAKKGKAALEAFGVAGEEAEGPKRKKRKVKEED